MLKHRAEIEGLASAYDLLSRGRRLEANALAIPVIAQLNNELRDVSDRSGLPGLDIKRHYLTIDRFLLVLCAQGFARTSLDSVTALSWNMQFGDAQDLHTIVGSLVRQGKRYNASDPAVKIEVIKALGYLAATVADKLSRPGDQRVVVSAPSSASSHNSLPRHLAELISVAAGRRYVLSAETALVRCRDIGQMKNIHSSRERLKLVKGSMVADPAVFKGKHVLLIDDLLGCGATMREAARSLKQSGAIEVNALVMTKTRSHAWETMI